ncbi:MAG: SOS response regulatory protein OraA/RecX [Oceanicoccus sp.]|jgi:SOS response regulatory protein OraA/RecX
MEASYQLLMEYALRSLSRRSHTVHEMREKLKKRPHYTTEFEQAVIIRLLELNLLNDELYVHRAVETAAHFRYQGLYKVAERLKRKGIPFEQTEKQWKDLDISEKEIAASALKKIEKRLTRLPKEKHYQKKAQFLAGRGFSPAVIFDLISN